MNEQLAFDKDGNITEELTDRQTDRQTWTLDRKIEESIRALRLAADMSKTYYDAPLIVTYSGGKDSDVMLHLAESCLGLDEFEVFNSHTTADAPPTVYHIREVFKRLNDRGIKTTIDYHVQSDGTRLTMWNLIPQKQMPPTRFRRYCCEKLKETGTPNRMCTVGVRGAESLKRQGRDIFSIHEAKFENTRYYSLEHTEEVFSESLEKDAVWDCMLIANMKKKKSAVVAPIYYWTDADVWEYVNAEGIKMNPLYKMGYDRVGCIGCPLTSYKKVSKEFSDFPQYKQAYIKAFERMLEVRRANGKDDVTGKEGSHCWKDGQAVFDWWVREHEKNVEGQMNLADFVDG